VAPPFRAVLSYRNQRSDTGQKPSATKDSQAHRGPYTNRAGSPRGTRGHDCPSPIHHFPDESNSLSDVRFITVAYFAGALAIQPAGISRHSYGELDNSSANAREIG